MADPGGGGGGRGAGGPVSCEDGAPPNLGPPGPHNFKIIGPPGPRILKL